MKTMARLLAIGFAAFAFSGMMAVAGTDKTLVSWVVLDNTTQQGGSALTIQQGSRFDAIVFGERAAGKWMAGSDGFTRTQGNQQANAAETADARTLIQMAIVYKGNRISLYRNGEPGATYEASNIDLLGSKRSQAIFGLRHQGAGTGQPLAGAIEDARIYDRALTADEIAKLEPNKESAIKAYAWWTFEKGQETDRMGRFPVNRLAGGARIEAGRLVLRQNGYLLASGVFEPETPAWPENPPANWLTFHLAHPGPGNAMPGDPNCAFYWKGRYHLHYIYRNEDGFVFAHVSSPDMVHWKWHPTTLVPSFTGHGMFSGTGFFTKEGKPAIIYHGEGSGRNQIAVAEDDQLEKWSKPWKLEPQIQPGQDAGKIANWDPDAWLDGNTYYALSGGTPGSGKPPTLFKSADLKSWDYLGLFLAHDMPDVQKSEDVSCPNFFKLGSKYMLLCISHNLGCRYYLGDWKDEKFTPDLHARMTWNGNHFFAPESLLTPDGRRVMWAWQVNRPIAPSGVQSLPRELSLPADGVLRIKPLRELESLRYGETSKTNLAVKSDAPTRLEGIAGDALELKLSIEPGTAREFGVEVFCDKDGKGGTRVAIDAASKILQVGDVKAPFELKAGERAELRVFIDKNLVEVFVNDRQAAVSARQSAPKNQGIQLFSKGGEVEVKELKCWKMKSIHLKD